MIVLKMSYALVSGTRIDQELTPQVASYAVLAVWTALCPEELIELQWDDIDLKAESLRVRRAQTRGKVKEPGTLAGTRTVKLLKAALDALRAQREHTAMFRQHVFHDPRTSTPYATNKQFREWQWRPAVTRAKVRYPPIPAPTPHLRELDAPACADRALAA